MSLALYSYRYIFPSRGVTRESPHGHHTTTTSTTTYTTLLLPPPLPVSPDAVATAAPRKHAPRPPRSCRDLLMAFGGLNTAERQPDAGSECCEGRRGRAPDLSDGGRPAREMYSLPLLYRNPSPYEYKSIEHFT